MWIYLNDRFVSEKEAVVSIFDYGFLYGDGLFESLRAYNGKIFALTQHLDRLSDAADRIQLSLPPFSLLKQRLYETLERNALGNAMIRLTITRGRSQGVFRPDLCKNGTLVITVRAFSGHPKACYRSGVSAAIISVPRTAPTGSGPAIKSMNFLNNILGSLETDRNEHFEGLLLTPDNFLSEGTISNLFWVDQGGIKTPSGKASILEGVTRGIIIKLAEEEGIPIEEGLYPVKSLYDADEAFLTSTGMEVIPLTRLDQKKIGQGHPGPVTQGLHKKLKERIIRETN